MRGAGVLDRLAERVREAMTDEELLRRIARRDQGAFRLWYERYSRPLYGYLYRLLRDAHAAEDALSEAMFAVWTEARRFRSDCRPRTWLYRIARNKAVEWLRRRGNGPCPLHEPEGQSPTHEREHVELRVTLEQALGELSPVQREVVELAFFHGLSYEEIARVMGCPVNTVKTRMFWAKRRLRDALKRAEETELREVCGDPGGARTV